jgi:tetratricopeptide (TPR) repeat protein
VIVRTPSVDELIEWFEDIVALTRGCQIVDVPVSDAGQCEQAFHELFERLSVLNPTPGDGASKLPAGSLVPPVVARPSEHLPSFFWFGCRSTPVPHAEVSQLARQLLHVAQAGVVGHRLHEASFEVIEALAGPHRVLGVGGVVDLAFGLMGAPAGGDDVRALAAMRELDRLLEPWPLCGDGGALEIDAPRARTRACIAAALLQQIASCAPVVLAIDGTESAGPFMTALLDEVAAIPAPILVVRTCRSGRWNAAPPSTSCPEALVWLSSTAPGRLVTSAQLALLSTPLDEVPATVEELVRNGALMHVADDVWRLAPAPSGTGDTVANDLATALGVLADGVSDDQTLVAIVSLMTAQRIASNPQRGWRLARLLASCGEVADAVRHGHDMATTATDHQIVSAWRRSCGEPVSRRYEQPIAAVGADESAAAIVTSCSLAPYDPVVGELLEHAVNALDASSDDEGTTRQRVAAGRALLTCGDAHGPGRAVGDLERWMTAETIRNLRALAAVDTHPGLVARSVEALTSLHLVTTARFWWPASAAVGIAALGRLELLDRLDRLGVVDDGLPLADEAVATFRLAGSPRRQWVAATWRAWCLHRGGRTAEAIAALDEIIDDEETLLVDADELLIASRLRRARCRIDTGDLDAAHSELDELLQVTDVLPNDDVGRLAVLQAHAVCVARLGDPARAVSDLHQVIAGLTPRVPAFDETLLEAQRQLASALVNCGRPAETLELLDRVVAGRSSVDLADAPRMLAALHTRAGARLLLGDHAAALDDLDVVVEHRSSTLEPADALLLDARCLRATALMVSGRAQDAIADLDEVVRHREQIGRPDAAELLTVRRQRAFCLAESGRAAEAVAEIDRVLAATPGGGTEETSMTELMALRNSLVRE